MLPASPLSNADPASMMKADKTLGCCVERVIRTAPDIDTGVNFRAALAHDNLSRPNVLSIADFYAETL